MWEYPFSKQWEAPCNAINYHDFLRKIKKSTKLELKAKLEVIEVFLRKSRKESNSKLRNRAHSLKFCFSNFSNHSLNVGTPTTMEILLFSHMIFVSLAF